MAIYFNGTKLPRIVQNSISSGAVYNNGQKIKRSYVPTDTVLWLGPKGFDSADFDIKPNDYIVSGENLKLNAPVDRIENGLQFSWSEWFYYPYGQIGSLAKPYPTNNGSHMINMVPATDNKIDIAELMSGKEVTLFKMGSDGYISIQLIGNNQIKFWGHSHNQFNEAGQVSVLENSTAVEREKDSAVDVGVFVLIDSVKSY